MTRQFAIYCTCGGSMKCTLYGTDEIVNELERDLRVAFTLSHKFPSHNECDAKTSARARARAYRQGKSI